MVRILKIDNNLPNPKRAHSSDAGIDLYARETRTLDEGKRYTMPLGVAVDIPEGHVGLLCVRSGNAAKRGIALVNGVGVIDSGYHGEVAATLLNTSDVAQHIYRGDKIAQLLIVPCATDAVSFVDGFEESERGEAGFGSTGNR